MKRLFLSILSLTCLTVLCMAQDYHVIPFPNELTKQEGAFTFKGQLSIQGPSTFASEIDLLSETFEKEHALSFTTDGLTPDIVIEEDETIKDDEAYKLKISPQGISIKASASAGCFYAFQTIRQLMKPTLGGGYTVVSCEIEDTPNLKWRAYMLDEGRNFQGKEVVFRLLDEMARLKMNIFHWHLTEDQGWRIEIKKYPLLTEVGAWRDSTVFRKTVYENGKPRWIDNQPYSPLPAGGFYTQEEVREIVAYAAKRHIDIVPEIEMPGHASAAIAAYPWLLSDDAKPTKVPVNYGIKQIAYNVASERVYTFLTDVLTEVMALFPFHVIHIGGDEVRYNSWESNSDIKALMKKEKLQSFSDVQVFFTNRISNFIESKGRSMMGWNEILGNVHVEHNQQKATSKLAQSSIIHFWKGDQKLLEEALIKGYKVVNSWTQHTYLDYVKERQPIEKVYSFKPVPEGLTAAQQALLIGIGCQMWGEVTVRPIDVYAFTFPRIAAIAEVGWTKTQNKDFNRFMTSLQFLKYQWDKVGLYYYEE